MGLFDSKNFNSEVFAQYLETVPRVKQDAFLKAGILRTRDDLKTMLVDQVGGNFISIPMVGRIGGTALNYDGNTDITPDDLETFLQNMIVVGRAKAWKEKDFNADITGHNFMENIAAQVADYWDDVDQLTILNTLEGIFGVTEDSFNTKHTLDLTGETGDDALVGAGTLNDAITQGCGDNKDIMTCVFMHSVVANRLENLQLLEYWKQTDANGIERQLKIASWSGRTVFVDDDCPATAATGEGATGNIYTTYVLGADAFDYVDAGAKVPVEPWRDPHSKGGYDELITRQRKVFAPRGFSFSQPTTPIVSPTDAQLKTAARWKVVKDSAGTGFFNSKAIPFVRILSKG